MSKVVEINTRDKHGRVECPACQGTGITDEDDFEDCPVCDGEGKVDPEQIERVTL